jgi:hypothetical protein
MKTINFNTWQCYYMDNDGRKEIIATGLSYEKAVKLSQRWCTLYNIYVYYE